MTNPESTWAKKRACLRRELPAPAFRDRREPQASSPIYKLLSFKPAPRDRIFIANFLISIKLRDSGRRSTKHSNVMSDFGHFGSDEEYATVRKHNAEVVSFRLYPLLS